MRNIVARSPHESKYGAYVDEGGTCGFAATSSTSRVRGPCTPSTRLSSISLVALGPEMNVNGLVGSRVANVCGTVSITWVVKTTQM